MRKQYGMSYICMLILPWLDDIFFERFGILRMRWEFCFIDAFILAFILIAIQYLVGYTYEYFEECLYTIFEQFKIYPEHTTMRTIEMVICSLSILCLALCANLVKLAIYFQYFKDFIYIIE